MITGRRGRESFIPNMNYDTVLRLWRMNPPGWSVNGQSPRESNLLLLDALVVVRASRGANLRSGLLAQKMAALEPRLASLGAHKRAFT